MDVIHGKNVGINLNPSSRGGPGYILTRLSLVHPFYFHKIYKEHIKNNTEIEFQKSRMCELETQNLTQLNPNPVLSLS